MAIHALREGIEKSRCLVAILAGNGAVLPDQRECAQVMVESDIQRPLDLAMTGLTPLSKLSGMRIVRLVAAKAGRRRRIGIDIARMALGARERLVRAIQRKTGIREMLEFDVQPFGASVAIRAARPIDAIVRIVGPMATHTVSREPLLELVAAVAILAGEASMPVGQREPGRDEMIEQHARPIAGRMAALAFGTVRARVTVVREMATHAFRRSTSILLIQMA